MINTKKCFLITCFFIFNFSFMCAGATYNPHNLKREYVFTSDGCFEHCSDSYCIECLSGYFSSIDDGLSTSCPPEYHDYDAMKYPKSLCYHCEEDPCFYFGYIDPRFVQQKGYVERQAQLLKKYPFCKCFWPETSMRAGKISDFAYDFFKDLLLTTKLSVLFEFNCYADYFYPQKYFVRTG